MLRVLVRIFAALLALVVVVIGLEMIAAESGEVVVLATQDATGARHETRLWVVDHEGSAWLRSGSEAAAWFLRLRERPEVEVARNGAALAYRAVPVPGAREPVNRLMQEKYGWADSYIGFLFGRDDSLPIRLDPR